MFQDLLLTLGRILWDSWESIDDDLCKGSN